MGRCDMKTGTMSPNNGGTFFIDASKRKRATRCVRNRKTRARHVAAFKILVDFCFRTSLAVTLVLQLLEIDHHFFLDFIFQ
jgi:hypothetical protein